MKTKRHKHNWCIYFAETRPQIIRDEMTDIPKRVEMRTGCTIACSICGKQKHRLSKKIGSYYANTKKPYFNEQVQSILKPYYEVVDKIKESMIREWEQPLDTEVPSTPPKKYKRRPKKQAEIEDACKVLLDKREKELERKLEKNTKKKKQIIKHLDEIINK